MSAPDYTSSSGQSQQERDLTGLAETAKKDATQVAKQVKDEALALGDEVKAEVSDAVEKTVEKAKTVAGEQKDLITSQLSGVSEALTKVADELDGSDNAGAGYVRMVADTAQKWVSNVENNSVDDLLRMAQDFGRKQPVAFMGVAALLGFAASRFVLASASRASDTDTTGSQYSGQSNYGGSSNYSGGQSTYRGGQSSGGYGSGNASTSNYGTDRSLGGSSTGSQSSYGGQSSYGSQPGGSSSAGGYGSSPGSPTKPASSPGSSYTSGGKNG